MKQFLINDYNENTDWSKYLNDLDKHLRDKDYVKYFQKHKQSDFGYWKQYKGKYQIGILIYDFRKYPIRQFERAISYSYECMPLNLEHRCDLSVTKPIELDEFELMAKDFYKAMLKYI